VDLFEEVRRLGALAHMMRSPAAATARRPSGDFFFVAEEGRRVVPARINPVRMPTVNGSAVDWSLLQDLSDRARRHVRQRMTTAHVVRRVLLRVIPNAFERVPPAPPAASSSVAQKGGRPLRVLLVLRNQPTYMSFALEHGLDALGVNYTATFERPYLRRPAHVKSAAAWAGLAEVERDRHRTDPQLGLSTLHGKGVGYSFRLGPLRNPVAYAGRALADRILRHGPAGEDPRKDDAEAFDAIIYAFHEPPALAAMPMLRAITAEGNPHRFPRERVAIVDDNDSFDGSDARIDWAAEAASAATLFRREPLRPAQGAWTCMGRGAL
jgi:hypothetical protein